MNAIDDGTCYGYTNTSGKNKGKLSRQKRVARESCTVAHGPRPFPKAVCRHLCKNDSYVGKRGEDAFICIHPAHIEWGTREQNMQDAGPANSASKKGKKLSEFHCLSIVEGWKKRGPATQVTRKKMSDAKKGKKRGPYKPRKKTAESAEQPPTPTGI